MRRAFAVGSTLLGTAAFVYTLSAIGVAQIEQAIARVGWGLAGILLISTVREVAKAAAWAQTFTGPYHLPLVDAFRARTAGEALTTLLPMGFVVGEPTKAHYVDDRMPFAKAFGGLMLEFAFYTASLVLFAVAALTLLVPNKVVLVATVAAVPLLLAVKPVRRAVEPVRSFVIERPLRACAIGGLEIAYHALGLAETYLILRFLTPASATWTAAVGFDAVNRGVTLAFKMVPMRVGIDEATAALVASRLAISPTTGVMLVLVRRLRVLFWTAIGLLAIAVRTVRRCATARTFTILEVQKQA